MSGRTTEPGLAWREGPVRAPSGAPGVHLSDPSARSADAVAWVEQVINDGIARRASDVHFEPLRAQLRIRMRIDGQLQDVASPPGARSPEIASRIKVLAQLDIAEQRVPQDGRLEWPMEGRKVDLRVSTLPTAFGESIVIRVLDRNNTRPHFDGLHIPNDVLEKLRLVIGRPHGLVLVTGPTGSGKTTTLYGALAELNEIDRKVMTVEDPVEFKTDGLVQVSVDAAAGLTFARTLRSFLRQDPDVIMVGEIRDTETAQVATQAALTGHLVLTTLHTGSAAGAVSRLYDLGVEPFLVANALEAVLAQRLVRRICPRCRERANATTAQMKDLGLTEKTAAAFQVFRGAGCAHCQGTGFDGRIGLFEFLEVVPVIRNLIIERSPVAALESAASTLGFRTLRCEGVRALRQGLTTIEEVLRHT